MASGNASCYFRAMKLKFSGSANRVLAALIAGLLLAGCATTHKVNWNSRVGIFNYDQALEELGSPEKFNKLPDGGIVAEWLARGGPRNHFETGMGSGVYSGGIGVGIPQPAGHAPLDDYIRLKFDPNGRLAEWCRELHR